MTPGLHKLYFLKISPLRNFISRPCLMQRLFKSTEITCTHVHSFNNAPIDPVPCNETLRAAFIGISLHKDPNSLAHMEVNHACRSYVYTMEFCTVKF